MLKKIYSSLLEKFESVKSIFIRYFLYSFALIESFTLPKLINAHDYSQYEYYKNFIFIFPYFLLGAHSGYVYLRYSSKVDYYQQLFSIGLLVTLLFSFVFSIFFKNAFLVLPLVIIGVYTISEQYLKIHRKFVTIFLFKPLLSVITVGVAYFFLFTDAINISYNELITFSFGGAFLIWFILCPDKKKSFPIQKFKDIKRITIMRYGYMVKVYFTGVLTSLLMSALIFFERYFTEKYYPESIASYSFAFNLSQIVVVLLSAVSYITSVELGERKDNINRSLLKKQFIKATGIYMIFLVFFTLFLYFINPYYSEFNDLIKITLLITYAKGLFYLVGTVSHLAVYHGHNTRMLKGLLLFSVLEITIIYLLILLNSSLPTLLLIDSIFLLLYSVYILNIVFNKIPYASATN